MVLWKNCHALEQFSTVENDYYVVNKTFFYFALSNFQFFNGLMLIMLMLLKEMELANYSLIFLCFLHESTIK